MSQIRRTEQNIKITVGTLRNMSDRDRLDVITRLVAQLSFDEVDQLRLPIYRELNSRGGTRVGHRADRFERPKALAD